MFIVLSGCSHSLEVKGDLNDNSIDITVDGRGTATYKTPDGREITLTTQEKKEPSLIRTIFEAVLYKKINDDSGKTI